MTEHFIEICDCGNVVSQCRCPSPTKMIRVRPGPCKCAAPNALSQARDRVVDAAVALFDQTYPITYLERTNLLEEAVRDFEKLKEGK